MRSFNRVISATRSFIIIAFIILSNLQFAAAVATISSENTIDTPDRTVTFQDKNYEVQEISVFKFDEPVNISVNVTDKRSFQLSLMDKNKNFLWNHMVYYAEGKTEVTMPSNVVTEPGTYAFLVFYQGEVLAFKPAVFSPYKMSVIPAATTVAPGTLLPVKIEVEPVIDMPVKIVLARNSSSIEYTANRTGEGLYESNIQIPASADGIFTLYAAIASDKMISGYPEIIGISGGANINITDIPDEHGNLKDEIAETPPHASGPSFSVAIGSLLLAGLITMFLKNKR